MFIKKTFKKAFRRFIFEIFTQIFSEDFHNRIFFSIKIVPIEAKIRLHDFYNPAGVSMFENRTLNKTVEIVVVCMYTNSI